MTNYKITKGVLGGIYIVSYYYNPVKGYSEQWNTWHTETLGM